MPNNRQNDAVKNSLPIATNSPLDTSHGKNKKCNMSRGMFAGSFGNFNNLNVL